MADLDSTGVFDDPVFRQQMIRSHRNSVMAQLAGTMCATLPFCAGGLILAAVGLAVHREHKHVFTWLGLFANGAVLCAFAALAVLSALFGLVFGH
jgi:hypothetical protein